MLNVTLKKTIIIIIITILKSLALEILRFL